MGKRKQIISEDFIPTEMPQAARVEELFKRKNNKYKPVPKFRGGCKNC